MGGAQPDRRSGEHRTNPIVVGIVPAGGSGERLGADRPKAFVVVGGKPMLEHGVEALGAVCERVLVAVPEGEDASGPDRVPGGPSRSASVRNAVRAAPDADVYVVHDAARPLVTPALVTRCIDALDGVDAAIAAARVTDTIKRAGPDGRVTATLDRSELWAIQTPQAFRGEALRRALEVDEEALAAATDDAALVEASGGAVRVVEAGQENFKVTTAADLARAEAALGC